LTGFAWQARGDGWFEDVPEAAWPVFFSRVRRAIDAIRTVERKAPTFMPWYPTMLTLIKADDRGLGEWYSVFERGAAVNPAYWPLYTECADRHLTRWSGSPAQLNDFVQRAIELTQGFAGKSVAARIVLALLPYFDSENREIDASLWPQVCEGFQDWSRSARDPAIVNYFAVAARYFEDKSSCRSALSMIGKEPLASVWNGSVALSVGGLNNVRAWAKR
jgi:hypothetical protein